MLGLVKWSPCVTGHVVAWHGSFPGWMIAE